MLHVNSILYNFTILTNLQYNDSKFKGLLIDLDEATWSTSDLSQLKALQCILFIEPHKTTAGLINFVFEIGSISFIDTVNLNTPLKMIIFHIVQVNILFLLYLVDIAN